MKDDTSIQTIALQRALRMLDAAGARYHVIDADGAVYGEPLIPRGKQGPRVKSPLKRPYGAVRNSFRSIIDTMELGDVREVPADAYGVETVQAGILAYATERWGAKAAITKRATDRRAIEVMRVA